MEDKYGIKGFFNNIGVSSAIMAGFSFTAIIELERWQPVNNQGLIREIMYVFLVISFVSFVMPLLLNALFLNISIDSDSMVKKLRKTQLTYTIMLGVGVGGLLGALCLFVLGSFTGVQSYILIGIMIASLLVVWFIMHRFVRSNLKKKQ